MKLHTALLNAGSRNAQLSYCGLAEILPLNVQWNPSEVEMFKHKPVREHQQTAPVWRELTLGQMMDDAIVQDLMRSDRVSRGEIEQLFGSLRRSGFKAAA